LAGDQHVPRGNRPNRLCPFRCFCMGIVVVTIAW